MEAIQLEKLEIKLDDKDTYMGGDTVSGAVNIKLNGKLKMSIVSISLRAMAAVRWVEYPSTGDMLPYGFVFNQSENYFDIDYPLPDNLRNGLLERGSHSIPFQFKLPVDIPSSVDTDYGYIKFWVQITIKDDAVSVDFPVDYHEKKHFSVESPFRQNLHLSVGAATEKDFSYLGDGSGKVHLDATLQKKGHISGETIEVHCSVTNHSLVNVTPRISFLQTQIFMAKDKHKTAEVATESIYGEPVKAGETKEQNIAIQIPKETSLTLKSNHITIKYFVRVTLDIPNAIDLNVNLPLVITNQTALNQCFELYKFIE